MKSLPARPIKRAPTHPGIVIADILDGGRISVRAMAKAIGMSPNGLNKIANGQGPVTPETALRIATYFGTDDAETWLAMQADYDLWHARIAMKDDLKAIEPLPRETVAGLPAE